MYRCSGMEGEIHSYIHIYMYVYIYIYYHIYIYIYIIYTFRTSVVGAGPSKCLSVVDTYVAFSGPHALNAA